MNTAYMWLLCSITATGFAGWAIVFQKAGIPPYWRPLLLMLSGLLPALIPLLMSRNISPLFDKWSIWSVLAIVTALLNGIAVITYGYAAKNWELSRVVPIVLTLTVILSIIGGRYLLGEPITTNKIIGLFVAIYFFSR